MIDPGQVANAPTAERDRNEVFAGGYRTGPDFPTITWTEDQLGKGIFDISANSTTASPPYSPRPHRAPAGTAAKDADNDSNPAR